MICTLPDVLAKEIYETQGGTLAIYFCGVLESKLVSVLCLISESQKCMKHRAAPWPVSTLMNNLPRPPRFIAILFYMPALCLKICI